MLLTFMTVFATCVTTKSKVDERIRSTRNRTIL